MLISLLKFQEKFRNYRAWGAGGGGFVCQLKTSKSGVCLDQNWSSLLEGKRRVGVRNLDFFRGRNK